MTTQRSLRLVERTSVTPEGLRRINPANPEEMDLDLRAKVDPTQWRGLSRPMTEHQRRVFMMLVVEGKPIDAVVKEMGWTSRSSVYGCCSKIGLSLVQLKQRGSAVFLTEWFKSTLRVDVTTVGELKIEPFSDIAHFRQATTVRVEQRIEGKTGKGYNREALKRVYLLSEVKGVPLMAIALIMGIHHNKVEELKEAAKTRLTNEEKKKLDLLTEMAQIVEK